MTGPQDGRSDLARSEPPGVPNGTARRCPLDLPAGLGLVLGQDRPQVPSAEDEHPVGDLCPGGEYEPFRVTVRARLRGGIFTALMPAWPGRRRTPR